MRRLALLALCCAFLASCNDKPADPTAVANAGGSVSALPKGAGAAVGVRTPNALRLEGALEGGAVRAKLRETAAAAKTCYASGAEDAKIELAKRTPVSLAIVIEADGSVTTAKATGELGPEGHNVATCLVEAVTALTFPRAAGPTRGVVTYPFILEPG